MGGEEPVRFSHVHIDQPVHRYHPPAGAQARSDQPPIGGKWLYLHPARTLSGHDQSLTGIARGGHWCCEARRLPSFPSASLHV